MLGALRIGSHIIQKALLNHVKPKHKKTLDELKKLVCCVHNNFLWLFSNELSYHERKAVYISEYGAYHLTMKCQLSIGDIKS